MTRERAANRQRLLIIDDHESHIRVDFIAYYIKYIINLLIIFFYYSHLLQSLNINIFFIFKRQYSIETHTIFRLFSQHISRAEWIELFDRARRSAMFKKNILFGFREIDLSPANSRRILVNLSRETTLFTFSPYISLETTDLNHSILINSLTEPVELI